MSEPDHGGDGKALPGVSPEHLEVTSIITHGRLASCDGFVETSSQRLHFSHVFRFAGVSKNARIKEARSYYIERPPLRSTAP